MKTAFQMKIEVCGRILYLFRTSKTAFTSRMFFSKMAATVTMVVLAVFTLATLGTMTQQKPV